jgi:hypothetical protein
VETKQRAHACWLGSLQEQLEELWQEVEALRTRNDALSADNATLLAERSPSAAKSPRPLARALQPDAAPAENGDGGSHSRTLEDARRQVADLQVH